jgi:hypothetical protein
MSGTEKNPYILLLEYLSTRKFKKLAETCLKMYSNNPDYSILYNFNLLIIDYARKVTNTFMNYLTNEEKIYAGYMLNFSNKKHMKLLYCIYTGNVYRRNVSYALLKCYQKFGTLDTFMLKYISRYALGEFYSIWVDILLIDEEMAYIVFNKIRKHSSFSPEILFFRGGSMIYRKFLKYLSYKHKPTEYNQSDYRLSKKWSIKNVLGHKIYEFIQRNITKVQFSMQLIDDLCDMISIEKTSKLVHSSNYRVFWLWLKNINPKSSHIFIYKKLLKFPYFFENFYITNNRKLILKNELQMIITTLDAITYGVIYTNKHLNNTISKLYNKSINNLIDIIENKTGIPRDVIQFIILEMLHCRSEVH